jgi:hypothetical protein
MSETTTPWWYTERYDEDGGLVYLPLPDFSTRGKAQAGASSVLGVDFTDIRVRKVWMRPAKPWDASGWCEDMAWECSPEHPDALPYWKAETNV